MIRINCWFRWPLFGLSLNLVDLIGISLNFVDLFWDFTKFRWPFVGPSTSVLLRISSWLKQYLEVLNRFNSWLKRLSRNWLRINPWLKFIPHVLIQIDSWLKVLPPFSIQINSWQAKSIWFWVDSLFDSESYPCLAVKVVKFCVDVCYYFGATEKILRGRIHHHR